MSRIHIGCHLTDDGINRFSESTGQLSEPGRRFSRKRLLIQLSFACNHDVGGFHFAPQIDRFCHDFETGANGCATKSHQAETQTACCAGAGLIAVSVRDLRDYTRMRTRLIQERTRCWQRLEKLLEGALVKLSSVASKLTTVSAQDMIKALIAGQRDPRVLAGLARGRMRAKHDDLLEALDGMFDDHHGELAGLLLDQIASLDAKIAQLGARAAELAAAMPEAWGADADGTTGPHAGGSPGAPVLNAVARLAQIPGISEDLARSIIAETGLDMSRFPTAAHLVSWAGLCPSARQSGTRTRAGKKGEGNGYLRGSLGQAAIGAAATATFLGERYHRIARHRGKAKAQVAVARSILVIIWHLLKDPQARFTDLGPGYYQARLDTDRKLRNHIRQIQALGFDITLTKPA